MDLVLVLLLVLIGVGAIVYAGLRQPARPAEPVVDGGSASGEDHGAGAEAPKGDGDPA
ncbi:MAG: hypothetical protein KIT02_16475 [Devosia sp.]|uniref:hypothetical protein n=1 Tax=Devosia sp. TaxID=1871048 RepID=UPI0024CBDF24|nr:hypothetical protein [Devosia sp.]UYN99479.1 MAG: hypothetical protein KIT02_16475 [Devosia sp.]